VSSDKQASPVADELFALYGAARDLCAPRSVTHVVSSVRGGDGRLRVIAIGEGAPQSATDFFVLSACRARADAVLTSAEILRREPQLSLAFVGPWAAGFSHYRRENVGKAAPLACAVLTLSGALPLAHPLWHEPGRKIVLTSDERAPQLRDALGERAEVWSEPALTPRRALERLHEGGLAAVSVEAGPTVARSLYEPPTVVDELWLSIAELPEPERFAGKPLPPDSLLFAGRVCVADTRRRELSGSWRFQRWLRA
jgi:riboflavin biosynthesis pyrimidine reductase